MQFLDSNIDALVAAWISVPARRRKIAFLPPGGIRLISSNGVPSRPANCLLKDFAGFQRQIAGSCGGDPSPSENLAAVHIAAENLSAATNAVHGELAQTVGELTWAHLLCRGV